MLSTKEVATLSKGGFTVRLKKLDLIKALPRHQYPELRPVQEEALEVIAGSKDPLILELPTGSGKTLIGYTVLSALAAQRKHGLFYVVPTKAQAEQVKRLHPDVHLAFGRNEHQCLYYPGEEFRADEIPCSLLVDCRHRVDQTTGATMEAGVTPCPYLRQKFDAKQGQIVVCTTAYYLFTHLFSGETEQPNGVVFDEVHRLAQTVRDVLSYDITDWHLGQAVDLITPLNKDEGRRLKKFRTTLIRIARRRAPGEERLLKSSELEELIECLKPIRARELMQELGRAIREHVIDPLEKREVLHKVEGIVMNLGRYLRTLELALEKTSRRPLTFVFATSRKELREGERTQYRLTVKSYYVAPIVGLLTGQITLGYSATIGDPDILGYETGLRGSFKSFTSDFPSDRTRIFMPTDTPNLTLKVRRRDDLKKSLKRIVGACERLRRAGHRSLVIVVSEVERESILKLFSETSLVAMSYGNGTSAKEVAAQFRDGVGDVLVGTFGQFGEGIDLPNQLAPVTFVLRPNYPSPASPVAQFEEARYSSARLWAIRNWRVMISALQARGRNVRSTDDKGVTIFVSQKFRDFLFRSLPEYLQPSYVSDKTFDGCVHGAIELLKED